MAVTLLMIEADPSGVVVTTGEDDFGRPLTAGIDLCDLESGLRFIAEWSLDRAYFSEVAGNIVESDLVECVKAVRRAQARHEDDARDELPADEAGGEG